MKRRDLTLFMSTCFKRQLIGLFSRDEVIAQSVVMEEEHLGTLMPRILDLLEANGCKPGDLDVVCVDHGPGSFTGLRIGVSTARALSQVLKVPCVTISCLDAYASMGREVADWIVPMVDAKRQRVYSGLYRTGAVPRRIGGYLDQPPFEVARKAVLKAGKRTVCYCGNAVSLYEKQIREASEGREIRVLDADCPEMTAYFRVWATRGRRRHWRDIKPLYIRRSDAESARTD